MSHTASTVDTLLIRPLHGDQAGAGDNKRTNPLQGIPEESPSPDESRPSPPTPSLPINPTKSADRSLTVA
jgi:hypothetical protein